VQRCYYVLALVSILLTPLATNPTGITVDMDLSIRPNAVNVDYSPTTPSVYRWDSINRQSRAVVRSTMSVGCPLKVPL
jgi:hypothetical protein